MLKKGRQRPAGDIAILIYCRAKNAPSMFLVPYRVVGATAEKRNSEWGSADNHDCFPLKKNAALA
jgi:hypothetical protein